MSANARLKFLTIALLVSFAPSACPQDFSASRHRPEDAGQETPTSFGELIYKAHVAVEYALENQ